ncbi:hypothetical protein [Nonlabens xiamenensis]|uniref:hypothetical protein n=1 Tax=Nonlabens xiamenensis TaxID=2341043 RepID=UPI000F608324|nr:hypothetical protein [Nonlabens xiamenensis]
MHKFPAFFLFLIGTLSMAQVGINTSDPQAELDVNGNIRVRNLMDAASGTPGSGAIRLIGVDALGNMVPVEFGEDIEVEGNTIRAKREVMKFGDLPPLVIPSDGIIDNLDIVILPGDRNEGKSIIRMEHPNTSGTGSTNLTISGIQAAPDGTQIWLYPVDGRMDLLPLSGDSLPQNQIQVNSHMGCAQYEMMRLVYDATIQKWVIMKHHG